MFAVCGRGLRFASDWSSPTPSASFVASQLRESSSIRRRSSKVSARSSAATQPRPTSRMANAPASTTTFIAATAEKEWLGGSGHKSQVSNA
eukprot:3223070-Pyramimonas_sp.AAC.1